MDVASLVVGLIVGLGLGLTLVASRIAGRIGRDDYPLICQGQIGVHFPVGSLVVVEGQLCRVAP